MLLIDKDFLAQNAKISLEQRKHVIIAQKADCLAQSANLSLKQIECVIIARKPSLFFRDILTSLPLTFRTFSLFFLTLFVLLFILCISLYILYAL